MSEGNIGAVMPKAVRALSFDKAFPLRTQKNYEIILHLWMKFSLPSETVRSPSSSGDVGGVALHVFWPCRVTAARF